MHFISTRKDDMQYTFSDTVRLGLPLFGGLFMPAEWPLISRDEQERLIQLTTLERAEYIFSLFAPEIPASDRLRICRQTFGDPNDAETPEIATKLLNSYMENRYFCFADNGPSGNYLDYVQRFQSATLETLIEPDKTWYVLAGTRLEELKGLAACRCHNVSWQPVFTIDDKAVRTFDLKEIESMRRYAVGNFTAKHESEDDIAENPTEYEPVYPNLSNEDSKPLPEWSIPIFLIQGSVLDTETHINQIMNNVDLRTKLAEQGKFLTVAGSMSSAALIVNVILLFNAWAEIRRDRMSREESEEIDELSLRVIVPSLALDLPVAALALKRMGLPIDHLVISGNRNRNAVDLIRSRQMNLKRRFSRTNAPLLDRLYPDNTERLVYMMVGEDRQTTEKLITELFAADSMRLPKNTDRNLPSMDAGHSEPKEIVRNIAHYYDTTDYVFDPATVTALAAADNVRKKDTETDLYVVVEHPLLSAHVISEALFGRKNSRGKPYDELLKQLAAEGGLSIPPATVSADALPPTVKLDNSELVEMLTRYLLGEGETEATEELLHES